MVGTLKADTPNGKIPREWKIQAESLHCTISEPKPGGSHAKSWIRGLRVSHWSVLIERGALKGKVDNRNQLNFKAYWSPGEEYDLSGWEVRIPALSLVEVIRILRIVEAGPDVGIRGSGRNTWLRKKIEAAEE